MADTVNPGAIADFWFSPEAKAFWWKKDPDFDQVVADRLGESHARAAAGALDHWAGTASGSLALVILLDQVPRNIYRDSGLAFAFDEKARSIARDAVDHGRDRELPYDRRFLIYMPFEHSESLADQACSVALFEAYGDESLIGYARRHSDIIRRFGRFPHRNAVLGRDSTVEEKAFLTRPDRRFEHLAA